MHQKLKIKTKKAFAFIISKTFDVLKVSKSSRIKKNIFSLNTNSDEIKKEIFF